MKYLIAIVFAAMLLTVAGGTVEATGDNDKTRVRGNIWDGEIGPVAGATVTVTCSGVTKTATTTSSGLYVVDYTKDECDKFESVTASVTHDGETQTNTVLVSRRFTATLDFLFGAASVPEFGMIPGVVAAVGSGAAYIGMKRRRLI